MWLSRLCGHCGRDCGREPTSTSPIRCNACLTTFCGRSCQASASKKHKSECHDLACKAFGRGVALVADDTELKQTRQWSEDMIALSWSMRKEGKALYAAIAEAAQELAVSKDESGIEYDAEGRSAYEEQKLPREVHFMALFGYLSDPKNVLEAMTNLRGAPLQWVTRAFDGFPDWPVKHATDPSSTAVLELDWRSFLVALLARYGNSKQAVNIGYSKMLPAIRELERNSVFRENAGVLQLMRFQWADTLLARAQKTREQDEQGLIKEAASMALACLRELEALPRPLEEVEEEDEENNATKEWLIEAAQRVVNDAFHARAFALCVRVGRWLSRFRHHECRRHVLEPMIESLVALRAVAEAEALLQEAMSEEGCPIQRGIVLTLYYKIAVCSPSSHERALALMSQALADLPPPSPPSSPPLPPLGDEEGEYVNCDCDSEHLSARAVRLRLLLACGYVSDCLGRAEECEDYDRQARVICPATITKIDEKADEKGRICDMNLHIREAKRIFAGNGEHRVGNAAFRLIQTLFPGPTTVSITNSAAKSEAWGLLADMVGTVKDVTGMKDHMYVIQAKEEKRWNDALQEVRTQIASKSSAAGGGEREELDLDAMLPTQTSRAQGRGKKHKKAGKKHKKKSKGGKGGAAVAKEVEAGAASKAEGEEVGKDEEDKGVETEEQPQEPDECCICLKELKRDEEEAEEEGEERRLACSHRFHSSCLVLWLGKCEEKGLAASCPMCRQAV